MIHFSREPQSATFYIQSYEPGCLTVNRESIHHSVIIFKDQLIKWPVSQFQELTPEHLKQLFDYEADMILLGTGEKQFFLPPALQKQAALYHQSLDTMSSKMAALTYNLLAQESRNPLLALIIR